MDAGSHKEVSNVCMNKYVSFYTWLNPYHDQQLNQFDHQVWIPIIWRNLPLTVIGVTEMKPATLYNPCC